MDLNAYTQSLDDILSKNSVYDVPRFQREYSWEVEEIEELWTDMLGAIELDGDAYKCSEYFIGTLVLQGSADSSEMQIVDGQQRLMTISIFLSAIAQKFRALNEDGFFRSIYHNYIEGTDDRGKPFFKVNNDSHNPFFKKAILYKDHEKVDPKNKAERRLKKAYDTVYSKLGDELALSLGTRFQDHEHHVKALSAVKNQITKFLKVIYIIVKDEEEAYTIFETLNARGINLGSVDLIKNTVFRDMQKTHPVDHAKEVWSNISLKLDRSNTGTDLDEYVRHWWRSRHSYVSADNLYKEFKKAKKNSILTSETFLEDISFDVDDYLRIISPKSESFRQRLDREIFRSLIAFQVFNVTQHRSLILSLFYAARRKLITKKELAGVISFLENFNFKYVAICKKRSSGIESTYSSFARKVFLCKTKSEVRSEISDLKSQMRAKAPSQSEFEQSFSRLRYTKNYVKDKRLIQYIFNKMEWEENNGGELVPENLSLEHIMSQSGSKSSACGSIGNLLPLSEELNGRAGIKSFRDKLNVYKESRFWLVQRFCEQYSADVEWDEFEIGDRASDLANLAFEKYWVL
ncbi:DUF262 domain-containing protein [Salinicola endophyticus]|uniref:DUF262 domain-containing protein n=1 Tax=Salinicola endophyticus TaxID=1949083 RepID=A0ABY8FLN9_9GAMM|nr:DUF262 domain-containing HNH endonuclease family protein [Salinicola endophyticus]WFF40779.1 DUF262 domain-containing protein [Salinicola endophyticus]